MITALVIIGILAVIYAYAAAAWYYNFKTWYPFCGCASQNCKPERAGGRPA